MIIEVNTTKNKRDFAQLGVDFSKSYPNGIPVFFKSQLELINKESNYVLNTGGKLKCFLYQQSGRYVGRIAAMINPELPDYGIIGLFDCIDDYTIASVLIDSAIDSLKEQGCERIIGPMNFSIFQSYRFMTSGFDTKSFVGEPRNHSYYPLFFEKYGFQKNNSWKSYYLDKETINSFLNDHKENYKLFKGLNYYFVKLDNENKTHLMEATYDILIRSYNSFPLFSHISKKDFLKEFSFVPDLMDRNCSLFIYNPERKMVGFILLMKDLTIAMQKMKSKTKVLSKLQFIMNVGKGNMANIAQGGSLPKYIKEAVIMGKELYGIPMSITTAGLYKSLDLALESGKYNEAVISLVRNGSEISILYDKHQIVKRQYSTYEFKLNSNV